MTILNFLFMFPQLLFHLVDGGIHRSQQILRLGHGHEVVLLGGHLQIDRGLIAMLQIDGELDGADAVVKAGKLCPAFPEPWPGSRR